MTMSSVMECSSKRNDSFLNLKQRKHICLKGILAGKSHRGIHYYYSDPYYRKLAFLSKWHSIKLDFSITY